MQEENTCDKVTEESLLKGSHVQWRHDSSKTLYLCDVKIDYFGGPIWYCFAEVEKPDRVWCEIREAEFDMMKLVSPEVTNEPRQELSSLCERYRQERNPRRVLVVDDSPLQSVNRALSKIGVMVAAASAANAFDAFPNIDIIEPCRFDDICKKKAAWKSPYPVGRGSHRRNSRKGR